MSARSSIVAAIGAALLFATAALPAAAPNVRSSLDGKHVLPYRIHWVAFPSVPSAQVAEVDFLVDGKPVWIERHPPYTYGQDGNWLVTSWLAPGIHRFTARLVTVARARASDTVAARTLTPPKPPAAVVGTWRRTVTQAQAGSQTPAGTWTLRIDASGWRITDPQGGRNWVDVVYPRAGRLQARGGIWTTPVESKGGNGWCEDTNVPVDYAWKVSGQTLAVTLVGPDRCGDPKNLQHFIWAGEWARAA
jgi:hypothetical protein